MNHPRIGLPRASRLAIALVAMAGLFSGCVQLPTSGPIEEVPGELAAPADDVFFQPPPPKLGESPVEIVEHFLDAMTATPIQTNIAAQFLSESARRGWRPKDSIVIYGDAIVTSSRPVKVDLTDARWVDAEGRWRGSAPKNRSTLELPVVLERGEWRIDAAPDALLVPQVWFEQRFVANSVYFFDPTGSVLIPERRFVPNGEQQATELVDKLLAGTSQPETVARSILPSGTRRDLPVTVDADGLATISFTEGSLSVQSPGWELARSQLSWTLRQVPEVSAFSVSVGGEELTEGNRSVFAVSEGAEYDPTGAIAATDLVGLSEGALQTGSPPTFNVVTTPAAKLLARARSLAVDLPIQRALVVGQEGRQAWLAELSGSVPAKPVGKGVNLRESGWDLFGQAWFWDQSAAGARVFNSAAGELKVPGISGQAVTGLLISRDGSTLVATLDADQDRVVKARIQRSRTGRVIGFLPAKSVALPLGSRNFTALAWRSPTSVAVLGKLPGGLAQVIEVPLDGSALPSEVLTFTLAGRYRWLAGSPAEGTSLYAISSRDIIDLNLAESTALPLGPIPSTVRYPG